MLVSGDEDTLLCFEEAAEKEEERLFSPHFDFGAGAARGALLVKKLSILFWSESGSDEGHFKTRFPLLLCPGWERGTYETLVLTGSFTQTN